MLRATDSGKNREEMLTKHILCCEEKGDLLFVSWNCDRLVYATNNENLTKRITIAEERKEDSATVHEEKKTNNEKLDEKNQS
jgi:hypothetical protein